MALSGAAIFFILLVLVAIGAIISYVAFTILRARRLGLPPPTLSSYNPFSNSHSYGSSNSSNSPINWVNGKIRAFRNRNNRSQTGGYEEPLSSNIRGRGNTRGLGPLDPDDAWDARVGNESDAYGPYNEENELGLHEPDTAYHGLAPGLEERGRSRSRGPEPYIGGSQAGLDRRYDEEMGTRPSKTATTTQNPFDDSAEVADQSSLRGVSPRPVDASSGQGHTRAHSTERRSLFRENV